MRRSSETDGATRAGDGADIAAGRLDNDAVERREAARATSADRGPLARLFGQLAGFGMVGGVAFVIDLGVYNVVRATVLSDSPIWSKVVSVTVATIAAWLGNRYLTFRKERSRGAFREGLLFAIVNVVGLLIAAGCLFVSHYLLGFTSQLADNISGNGVGLVLGTIFRFVAYRWIVFTAHTRTSHSTHRTNSSEAGVPS
ncbi:GtrA family protein [Microbacterium excoecariae]|uniref:GtrA family protein n=1 Tax=Microbacterium excoecariae TaxID=2715210 RepID=UPI00197BCBD5|nr:GtrA family protein [Microbacterium excoecariae]NHI16074.1 GtrA family protein [Microbacterium excoecariae]